MTTFEDRPLLKAGCRLAPSGDVLLIPEGVLRLQGPARQIIAACDGTRTVRQIVETLSATFPKAEVARVAEETTAFLTKLVEKGVIEFI
jgi:pyrroloquinoline quinone biosynthesis protein D